MALESASPADGNQATGSSGLPGCNRRQKPSTGGRFDTLRMAAMMEPV